MALLNTPLVFSFCIRKGVGRNKVIVRQSHSLCFSLDTSYKEFFKDEYNAQFYDKFVVYHIDAPGQVCLSAVCV